jgi:hypothetical protein
MPPLSHRLTIDTVPSCAGVDLRDRPTQHRRTWRNSLRVLQSGSSHFKYGDTPSPATASRAAMLV